MAHIAVLLPGLGGGGAERVALAVSGGLVTRGHRVDLVFSRPPDSFYPLSIPRGVHSFFCSAGPRTEQQHSCFAASTWLEEGPAFRERLKVLRALLNSPVALSLLRRRVLRRAFAILPYLQRERPEVIFANAPSFESPLYLLVRAGRATMPTLCPRIVCIVHNVVRSRIRRRGHVLGAAHRVVAVSQGIAENLLAVCSIPPEKVVTIHNPAFSPEVAIGTKEQPEHPWYSDGGPPIVLSAGRLAEQKDFKTLIDAFRRVRASYECRLIILGEGALRQTLLDYILTRNLEDVVSLPGWVKNPYPYMARSSLFVLSSRYEGFGIVLVEAMAMGCPAVSTDCPGGPAEILEDGKLLAPVGDAEALSRVMLDSLDRPANKATLRSKASRFSSMRAIEAYDRLVLDLV